MTDNRSNQQDLAERLDNIVPPGRSNPVSSDNHPYVMAALQLATAPYPQLAAAKKAQMLQQVLSAHQKQFNTGRAHPLTTTQHLLAAMTGLVLIATLAIAAITLSNRSSSTQNNGDLLPPSATIDTLAPTDTPTNTATSTPTESPTVTQTGTATAIPATTAIEATEEVGKGDNPNEFDCEHPGNYCNSQGTPGGAPRGQGNGNSGRP